jgi:hypothetical protein
MTYFDFFSCGATKPMGRFGFSYLSGAPQIPFHGRYN